jgi:hypothetical protein
LVHIKWVHIEADQKLNHFRVMLPCLSHLCHVKNGHNKKHSCDIILMISLLWLHVLSITKSFHVSIISPNCCYIWVLFVSSGVCVCVCVWPSFTKDVCDHNTLFATKALLIPHGDWCSWVGVYLEKANVGLGFFLRFGRHWDMGKLLQLETIMYSGFFLTKFVVFWTKKIGNDLWN